MPAPGLHWWDVTGAAGARDHGCRTLPVVLLSASAATLVPGLNAMDL